MTQDKFEMLQEEMTDLELIDLAEKQVIQLAKTGGRSHTMTVPPRVDDTDMIFSELIKRFKSALAPERDVVGRSEQLVCPHQATRTPNEEKTGKCRQCGRVIKPNNYLI